jgi:hypothetical protein
MATLACLDGSPDGIETEMVCPYRKRLGSQEQFEYGPNPSLGEEMDPSSWPTHLSRFIFRDGDVNHASSVNYACYARPPGHGDVNQFGSRHVRIIINNYYQMARIRAGLRVMQSTVTVAMSSKERTRTERCSRTFNGRTGEGTVGAGTRRTNADSDPLGR